MGHFPFSVHMAGVAGSVSLGLLPWLLELKCMAPGSVPFRVSTAVLMAFPVYIELCVFSFNIFLLFILSVLTMIGYWVLFFWSYLLNFVCFICLGNVFLSVVEVFFYDFVWSVPSTRLDCSPHTVFWDCYIHLHRTREYLAGELFHCLHFHVCVFVMS